MHYRHLVAALALGASLLPVVSSTTARAATAPASPSCVVSLSPTATDTLFAIGAGPQVQAVDKDSHLPAKGLPAKRIDSLNPSVEAIIGICRKTATHPSTKPDLVIISYDANQIKEKLTALGVRVVEQDAPANLAGALAQIKQLGALTGHLLRARQVATRIAATIHADVASIGPHPGKALRVYYEIDPTGYSLTSGTFVGSLLKALGVLNIADAQSTSADAGYPQLNSEYVISSNPQLVFLDDGATPSSLAARPGFSSIAAVTDHHVVVVNQNIGSEWGVRLGTLMNQLTAAVRAAFADPRLWG